MSGFGPTLPTWALQQVGCLQGYTGRAANVAAKAARDPDRASRRFGLDQVQKSRPFETERSLSWAARSAENPLAESVLWALNRP
jgi:hypothetical protein